MSCSIFYLKRDNCFVISMENKANVDSKLQKPWMCGDIKVVIIAWYVPSNQSPSSVGRVHKGPGINIATHCSRRSEDMLADMVFVVS